MIDRRDAILGTMALGLAAGSTSVDAQTAPPRVPGNPPMPGAPDPDETIDLWPGGAPGMPARAPVETVDERSKDASIADRAVRGIIRPRMAVFRPRAGNGNAVLITPGGGYRHVVIDKEGYELGRWLASRGWTCFVLFYRLPGDGWAAGPNVALCDAQRAIRLIRARAAAFGIRPDRVAALGFSAGGHVCGDLATRFAASTYTPVDAADTLSARPDIAAPIYAVQSMSLPLAHPGSRALLIGDHANPALETAHTPANNVTAQTPPIFMVHAEDDTTVPVANTLQMRAALKAKGIAVETHLFTLGGHGFGLRGTHGKPAAIWPDLFRHWAASQGFATA